MTDPIRICFVIEGLLPAGTELWTIRLIEALDRSRFRPYLCLIDGSSDLSKSLEPDDCEVIRFGLTKLRSLRGAKSALAFLRFLRANRIDVVQVHHADPAYFAVPIARIAGAKVVQTKYDTGYWLSGVHLWAHRLIRRLVHSTVANCEACKSASIAQEWSPKSSVVVLQNGIALERFDAIANLEMPQETGTIHFGMVCNLRAVKSPELFVEAAQRVMAVHPNSQFHIAGDGELRPELESMIIDLRLQDVFTLHGDVKQIPQFLQEIHIAVLCSQSEGLSHAILEYMAAGRAIIATRVGGNTELITHGTNGLLIPPNNVNALATAMCDYLADPKKAESLGQAARTSVQKHFSFQAMTERFENFYSDLLGSRPTNVVDDSFCAKARHGVS